MEESWEALGWEGGKVGWRIGPSRENRKLHHFRDCVLTYQCDYLAIWGFVTQ